MDTIDDYVAKLASSEPTPGGGSAAAVIGAMAAALVAMVARITSQNQAYSAHALDAAAIVTEADTLRDDFLAARWNDEAAYARVVTAMALPKATPVEKESRREAVQAALAGAAAAPLRAAGLARDVLALAARAGALGNTHLQSDVACAELFARASLAASAANVRINHAYLKDTALIASQETALRALESGSGG